MSELVKPGDVLPPLRFQRAGQSTEIAPGARGLLLYFMRSADCPICRAHARKLAVWYPDLVAGGTSVAVVVPELGRDVDVEGTLRTPYPVVSGVGAHEALGLKRVFLTLVQQSGTVVTDAQRRVTHLNRANLPTGALDEALVKTLL